MFLLAIYALDRYFTISSGWDICIAPVPWRRMVHPKYLDVGPQVSHRVFIFEHAGKVLD